MTSRNSVTKDICTLRDRPRGQNGATGSPWTAGRGAASELTTASAHPRLPLSQTSIFLRMCALPKILVGYRARKYAGRCSGCAGMRGGGCTSVSHWHVIRIITNVLTNSNIVVILSICLFPTPTKMFLRKGPLPQSQVAYRARKYAGRCLGCYGIGLGRGVLPFRTGV